MLTLHVDGDRWREHLRSVVTEEPDLVPVAKGNGYGFGNGRLARKAGWLGADTLAVGTYPELADVERRYDGDLLVLTPFRPWDAQHAGDTRVIHTVGRLEDLRALAEIGAATGARPRVVLERMTSMKRHGFTARGLREAASALDGVRLEGVSVHLPLGVGDENRREASELMTDVVAAGLGGATVWVSHLSNGELAALRAEYPEVRFRPRVGTRLWLGDRDALRVTARVLDVHPLERGELYGYRRRRATRGGHLLVVSGGTAHGIGLEAPTGEKSAVARAKSLAKGGLDAAGKVRSPYVVGGRQRFFAEPPHMQASQLMLPGGVTPPAVGDEVTLQVRFTATTFDAVALD